MTNNVLPFRATSEQACCWLELQTGTEWTLARLLEHGLIPYVWLDYDAAFPDLFGDANGGYAAPIFFEGDTARLAAGSDDVLITMTKDAHQIVTRLPAPGFRRDLHALRFLKKDLERLAGRLKHEAEPSPAKVVSATESRSGINRDQVMAAFAGMLRIDLAQALTGAGGLFGDEGARVKGSASRTSRKAMWNPVTLALGLNDVYKVPLPQLKRAFQSHDFLQPWSTEWQETLFLLRK